jgi:ABC-type multidrug transport system fused ATPase/permease subunit
MNQQLGRALRFVTPYWRRLILVLALSLASTGFSLSLPLLTRDFFAKGKPFSVRTESR